MRRTIASLLVALVTFSCDAAADREQRITLMVAGDPREIEAYRQVVAGFHERQDGIRVDLIPFAERDELIARLSTSLVGGGAPDLFLMNYRYYGQFAAGGALEPVGPHLRGSSVLSPRDFFVTAMEPFRWDGEQMCLPQNVSSLVVYYNVELFRAAGLERPGRGWTWDEMVRSAERITRDVDGDGRTDVHGLGVDPEIVRLAPVIWSNGGTLVDRDADPTRFAFDARAIDAIDRFLALRTRHRVTPTDVETEAEDLEVRFLSGSLGMLMESRRVVPTFRTIRDFGWDVAPFPSLRGAPVSVLHSDAYCITAASDAKREAWRFLEYALGPEGQRIAATTGRTVPSLRSVAEDPAFLGPGRDPAHGRVFLDQIPRLRAVPVISTWPQIEDVANGLLEEAYYGGGSAIEVAIELTRASRAAFERAA